MIGVENTHHKEAMAVDIANNVFFNLVARRSHHTRPTRWISHSRPMPLS